jgi:GNAT superfamily N-acetyltransferase
MNDRPAVTIRRAREADLPRVVDLIHGGALNPSNELPGEPLHAGYVDAWRDIESNPRAELMVAEHNGRVVGTLLFMVLPHIANRGGRLAQVESVHVDAALRSHGIGEQMIAWSVDRARALGCFRLQLTSDKRRDAAHRFYRRLGFAQSHEGFKLDL